MTIAHITFGKNRAPSFIDPINELKALDQSLHRHVVPALELRFSNGHLIAGEHQLKLTAENLSGLCSALNAPHGYLIQTHGTSSEGIAFEA